jgi:hypothetical protein
MRDRLMHCKRMEQPESPLRANPNGSSYRSARLTRARLSPLRRAVKYG